MLILSKKDKRRLNALIVEMKKTAADKTKKTASWKNFNLLSKDEAGLPVSPTLLYRIYRANAGEIPATVKSICKIYEFSGEAPPFAWLATPKPQANE